QTCSFPVTFTPSASFDCGSITGVPVAQLVQGASYSATINVPYTSGSGISYGANNLLSGGVALVRTPGTLSPGGGYVVYTMSGISNNSSSVNWILPESGCMIYLGAIIYGGNSLTSGPLAGTYTSGVAMTPSNTKTISIVVNAPGTYSIISNAVNGVTFAGSGMINSTGLKDIVLTASGIPASPGTYYYTVSVGGQFVNFGVTYQ
ncbi:MAG TPA: hypothetical protein VHM26_17450, partial [Chitinophagaceae bacterium]|nr:hypothetical protein [Chitinophagaceae bacterium]